MPRRARKKCAVCGKVRIAWETTVTYLFPWDERPMIEFPPVYHCSDHRPKPSRRFSF